MSPSTQLGLRPSRIAALFWLVFIIRVSSLMYWQSPTVDELMHIPAGYIYWHWKDFYVNREHPVLVKLVSAGGFAVSYGETAWTKRLDGLQTFFADYPAQKTLAGRWPMFIFSLSLLAVLHATLGRLFDGMTAALSTIALTLFPLLIAHSVFVHTDVAAALFYLSSFSILACWTEETRRAERMERQSGASPPHPLRLAWRWLALLGGVMALGMLAKYSMMLAVANSIIAILFLAPKGRRWRSIALFVASFTLFFILLSWSGYAGLRGDFVEPHAEWVNWIPVPSYYKEGLFMLWRHNAEGHENVFLMKTGFKGHVGYFPLALLLKTPIPVLIGMVVGTFIIFYRRYRWRWIWLLFFATYWAGALTSNLNLGARHILPVLVLMWVPLAAAAQAASLLNRWRVASVALMAWLVVSSFAHWGSELAYFNELVGSRNGWKYLGDSNVDWGQEVGSLARFVQARSLTPLYQDLFTPFSLSMYGIDAASLSDGIEGSGLRPGWYAVSAHRLATKQGWAYDYFRSTQPSESFGDSVYLYRVE